MISKKVKTAIALTAAGALCIAGGAFAASAWITGASNNNNTISTGEAKTFELTAKAENNEGLYPGDNATVTISANNKNEASTLTFELQNGETDSTASFTVTYKIGENGTETTYSGGISLEASESAYDVTFKVTVPEDAETTMAGQNYTVVIALNPAD